MASARPQVSVYSSADGKATGAKLGLPEVFLAPIRNDVVRQVHRDMSRNAMQARGTARRAGHAATAESWGTGRAVARIPRASGGGTQRSGQGAYGNMCRGGHMFGALKTYRRWHRRISRDQRRYATVSAIAASAVPALVQARGHSVDDVAELPLVVDDGVLAFKKTRQAIALLSAVEAQDDTDRVAATAHIRAGKGKWRNRRYVSRRGPLVVTTAGNVSAWKNVPGVDTCCVDALNLLQLAPGGHVGRFVIWTKGAFEKLPAIFSAKGKKGYNLPRHTVTVADVSKVLGDVRDSCRAKLPNNFKTYQKTNALKNRRGQRRLNPYAAVKLGVARSAKKSAVKKPVKTAVKTAAKKK